MSVDKSAIDVINKLDPLLKNDEELEDLALGDD